MMHDQDKTNEYQCTVLCKGMRSVILALHISRENAYVGTLHSTILQKIGLQTSEIQGNSLFHLGTTLTQSSEKLTEDKDLHAGYIYYVAEQYKDKIGLAINVQYAGEHKVISAFKCDSLYGFIKQVRNAFNISESCQVDCTLNGHSVNNDNSKSLQQIFDVINPLIVAATPHAITLLVYFEKMHEQPLKLVYDRQDTIVLVLKEILSFLARSASEHSDDFNPGLYLGYNETKSQQRLSGHSALRDIIPGTEGKITYCPSETHLSLLARKKAAIIEEQKWREEKLKQQEAQKHDCSIL